VEWPTEQHGAENGLAVKNRNRFKDGPHKRDLAMAFQDAWVELA
jgi:hypothetical protein